MMQSMRWLALFTLLWLPGQPVLAVNSGNVEANLISEVKVVAPGQSFWVALRQQIRPGWHTYWRNPGDSGAPTGLTWSLPTGFEAGPIQWPWPERIPYGPLMNYGYHGEVVFPVLITVPPDIEGGSVILRAKGEWLVCEEICIPEDADLELTLATGADLVLDASTAPLFQRARQRLPADIGVVASQTSSAEGIQLSLAIPGLAPGRIKAVDFFPYAEGVIDNPARQVFRLVEGGLEIDLVPGYDWSPASSLAGIVVVTEDSGELLASAFEIDPDAGKPIVATGMALMTAVLFAFLGGMILNLMPCVFPVLSIKILSLMQQVNTNEMRHHGWVYSAGVVLSFVAIAAVLIGLREGGAQIGWGFQLQSPGIVALLAYLFFLIGLNLMGYFEVGGSLMSAGEGLASRGGLSGSFFTGVLATVVAAPCTAPFMASAIGFALTQSWLTSLSVFAALGAGMAAPYLLLCYWPGLLQRLPRPGPWMARLKEALAFPMFASLIWLLWVVSQQAGSTGVLVVMSGMLALGFALWLLRVSRKPVPRRIAIITGVVLAAGALYLPFTLQTIGIGEEAAASSAQGGSGPVWEPYSEARLSELREEHAVFVNFTAAWCITCKVNEVVALDRVAVRQAFERRNVRYLKGDWTNEDPVITAALARYERNGVPLYLLYRQGVERAEVLPQILTESIVLDAIEGL